jgi:uncharacterized tellurite resistance protein B-like protein
LDAIKSYFQKQISPDAGPEIDLAHRLRVATCALLLEMAHADDEFSAEEQELIHRQIREHFQLSPAETAELLALADRERRESTDLYQFTRLIHESFDRSQKLAMLEQLWRVVYSDGSLEAHEDALMHKLSHLLGLRHEELIALKLKVKQEGS